jgi:Uma2 family endonuclease
MPTATKPRATVEDLHRVPGKAEIVDGKLVLIRPAGGLPGRAAGKVAASLYRHEEERGRGCAFGDNLGFIVNLPNRRSFSPDAAWYTGSPQTLDMEFLPGAPAFAAEVRSKEDYHPRAQPAIARKIRDYFAAGTQVIWDVDLQAEDVVKVYRATAPDRPTVYRRGELAEAEPAVPGWRMPVDKLFE